MNWIYRKQTVFVRWGIRILNVDFAAQLSGHSENHGTERLRLPVPDNPLPGQIPDATASPLFKCGRKPGFVGAGNHPLLFQPVTIIFDTHIDTEY